MLMLRVDRAAWHVSNHRGLSRRVLCQLPLGQDRKLKIGNRRLEVTVKQDDGMSRVLTQREFHMNHFDGKDDDVIFLSSKESENEQVANTKRQKRITWIGLWSNVALSGVKGLVGVQSGSMSLIADAIHSGTDVIADFVALGALSVSKKPADETHPYGYGHYESLATLVVSTFLFGAGIGIGYQSFEQLLFVSENEGLQNIAHLPLALGTIAASVIFKEVLYHETYRIGIETRSRVLVANAWHHRTDAFSSVMALVGVAGAAWGAPYLDPVAGLLVSGMILKAGMETSLEAVGDLTDRKRESDEDVIKGVYSLAREMSQESGSGIIDCHAARIRRLGHYFLLDFHLRVDPRLSITGAYIEKTRIMRRIYKKFPQINEIFVHVQAHPSRTETYTSSNFDKHDFRTSLSIKHNVEPKVRRSPQEMVKKRARPQFQIQNDVAVAIEHAKEVVPTIQGLSHGLVHYEIPNKEGRETSVTVEVNLRLDKDITLREADRAAEVARQHIFQMVPDVDKVDIHVELLDG